MNNLSEKKSTIFNLFHIQHKSMSAKISTRFTGSILLLMFKSVYHYKLSHIVNLSVERPLTFDHLCFWNCFRLFTNIAKKIKIVSRIFVSLNVCSITRHAEALF